MLEKESWCSVDLQLVSADNLFLTELPSESIALIVGRNPLLLSKSISRLRDHSPDSLFAFVNLFRESRYCLDLLAAGFDNFLTYPFQRGDIAARLQSMPAAARRSAKPGAEQLATTLTLEVGLCDLIGVSPPFNRVLSEIKLLSRVDATVLIIGETGTGKDICARAIHYSSSRSERPFIPINCGAIPDELFENELFGHERGAYTDARFRQTGLIEQANGGTLFLDEIESLSMSSQVRLLRFLQGNEYTPLGSGKPLRADVRVIAATNADLMQRVREKSFREDVYYRLEVLTLSLPPLRERCEDIPSLAGHLVARYCSLYGKPQASLTPDALQTLKSYSWPGNVRELENVIHKAVIHASSNVLTRSDILLDKMHESSLLGDGAGFIPFDQARHTVLSRFEREYVSSLLRLCGGNVTRAAQRAGKHRRTFWEIMRRNNLSRSNP
jgi:DNA-binding NtrC family response regulator